MNSFCNYHLHQVQVVCHINFDASSDNVSDISDTGIVVQIFHHNVEVCGMFVSLDYQTFNIDLLFMDNKIIFF